MEMMAKTVSAPAYSEERLRAVLDNTVDGIITIDSHGIVQTYNPACEKIFGYMKEDVIGQNISMLMPEPYRHQHDGYLANYLKSHHAKIIGIGREVEGQRKDRSTFPMELSIGEVLERDSHMFVGIIRDITERKESEKRLKESNQALDDFVYIASHDLKEPLRGISNFVDFLLEDYTKILDEEGIKKLQTLKNLSVRMQEFIDQLLEYSKTSRRELVREKTDLNRVIKDVLSMMVGQIREKNVEVLVPQTLPSVMCDAVGVAEVFRNLIVNAIKYNDKDKKVIDIGFRLGHPRHPEAVVFYVKDNGIGISEEFHRSVFKIFKRLHRRDEYGGGTGSGLTIVKKIIERHNGDIWIESKVGKETSFYFTLVEALDGARK